MPANGAELDALAADIQARVIPRITKLAELAIEKTGNDVVAVAMTLVRVDAGNLRNSIGVDFPTSLSFVAGPTADYGIYQEFGTSKMAGQPYMNPALDQCLPDLTQALGQVIKL